MNELGDAAINQISTYLNKIDEEGKYKAKLQVGKGRQCSLHRKILVYRQNKYSSCQALFKISCLLQKHLMRIYKI